MRFISELHALSFNDARHSDACSMVLPWIQGKCKDQGLQASTSEYLEQSCPPSRLICCQRAFSYWAPLDVIKDFEVAKPFCFPSSSRVLTLYRYLLVFFESDRSSYLHDRSLAPDIFGSLATNDLKSWLFVGACFSSLLGVNLAEFLRDLDPSRRLMSTYAF